MKHKKTILLQKSCARERLQDYICCIVRQQKYSLPGFLCHDFSEAGQSSCDFIPSLFLYILQTNPYLHLILAENFLPLVCTYTSLFGEQPCMTIETHLPYNYACILHTKRRLCHQRCIVLQQQCWLAAPHVSVSFHLIVYANITTTVSIKSNYKQRWAGKKCRNKAGIKTQEDYPATERLW